MSVYVDIPPRRVEDYSHMRITYNDPTDTRSNWLVLSPEHRPKWMQINVYKTSGRYGQYTLKTLPNALRDTLQAHIIESNLSENSPLFGTAAGRLTSASAFSTVVGNAMLNILGRRATVNILRHSKISDFLKTRGLTLEKKDALAKQMAHSVIMQAQYEKLDVDPEAIDIDSDDEGEEVIVLKVKAKTQASAAAAAAAEVDKKPVIAKKPAAKTAPKKKQQAPEPTPQKQKRKPPNPRGRK